MDVKWDQSRLDRAIEQRIALMGRTAADVVNTAAYWIAVNTKNSVPFSTLQRIDTDLNVAVDLVKTQGSKKFIGPAFWEGNGQKFRTGQKFQKSRRNFGALGNLAKMQKYRAIPLLALIIQARANPGSKYNKDTGGRYAMTKSLFEGRSRAGGAEAMLEEMRRVLSARHSSIKYLLSGEVPAVRTLAPLAVNRYRRGSGSPSQDMNSFFESSGETRGYAIPASEGFTTSAKIVNATGTIGANAKSQNEALWKYVAPARRAAEEREAALMEEYVARAMAKGNAQFNAACA